MGNSTVTEGHSDKKLKVQASTARKLIMEEHFKPYNSNTRTTFYNFHRFFGNIFLSVPKYAY